MGLGGLSMDLRRLFKTLSSRVRRLAPVLRSVTPGTQGQSETPGEPMPATIGLFDTSDRLTESAFKETVPRAANQCGSARRDWSSPVRCTTPRKSIEIWFAPSLPNRIPLNTSESGAIRSEPASCARDSSSLE